MDIIERLLSDTLWIYTAILGSIAGAAFLFWFKDTRMALWGVHKFDAFLEHLIVRWGWTWLESDHLAWRKKYPKIALRKKWEGKVIIAIYYDDYGSISKINIHKSSGKSVLDRAALDIVNDSLMEDLPTTPDTLNGNILLFTIDFLLNT